MNANTNPAELMPLLQLTVADVLDVYSGRAGRCCCGCSGKYSYNSAYVELGGQNRGYAVDAEDISDRNVKRILNLVQRAIVAGDEVMYEPGVYVATEVGNRLYTVYFVEAAREREAAKVAAQVNA